MMQSRMKLKGNTMEIQTKNDALTWALFLSVTADSEARAEKALRLAESIANSGMTSKEVTACQRAAEEMLEEF